MIRIDEKMATLGSIVQWLRGRTKLEDAQLFSKYISEIPVRHE